jgi:hypothetical protein
MSPGGGLITLINDRLPDESFRRQIRELHAQGAPLLAMVETLGLAGEMSPAVRDVVVALSPDDIAGIRQATLEMLDRAENQMPVDCDLSQRSIDDGLPVTVTVVDTAPARIIRVRAAT